MARLAVLPLLLAAAAAQTALVFSTTNFAFVGNAFQYGDLTGAVRRWRLAGSCALGWRRHPILSAAMPLAAAVQVLTQATGSQGGAVWLKQTYRISSA